jgi:HEAT repeat protein
VRHASLSFLMAACVLWGTVSAAPAAPPARQVSPAMAGRMLSRLKSGGRDWLLLAEAFAYLSQHQVADAIEPCRKILQDPKQQAYVRGQALVTLVRIGGPKAKADVLKAAQDQDPSLRAAAAQAMEYLGSDGDESVINKLLTDKDAGVRSRALVALAARSGPKAWPKVEAKSQKVDPTQIRWIVRALALVGTDEAMKRLASVPRKGEHRRPYILGLTGIADAKLIQPLFVVGSETGAEGSDFAAVITALRRHKTEDVLSAMTVALQKPSTAMIRTVAVLSVRLVSSPKLGDALSQSLKGMQDAHAIEPTLVALGRYEMEPGRFEQLFKRFLSHRDASVRSRAVRSLAHCKRANMYAALKDRVGDSSEDVVRASLRALLQRPVLRAPVGKMVAYLQKPLASQNEEIRNLAVDLLGHAGSEDDFKPAMELFGEGLRGKDEQKRAMAADALGRIAPANRLAEVVQAQGYLSRFHIIGTFMNDEKHAGFNKSFPPETEIDFKKTYKSNYVWVLRGRRKDKGPIEREIAWTKVSADQTNGKLNVAVLVPPPAGLAVAYVVCDFDIDAEREVLLSVDGDDAFRLWLNGKKIADKIGVVAERKVNYRVEKYILAEEKNLKVKLKSGRNRLVIKTANIDKQWWVRVRLTNAMGLPVHVKEVVE